MSEFIPSSELPDDMQPDEDRKPDVQFIIASFSNAQAKATEYAFNKDSDKTFQQIQRMANAFDSLLTVAKFYRDHPYDHD